MITLASAQSHPRTPSQVCGHGHHGGCAVDHDSNPSKERLRSKAARFHKRLLRITQPVSSRLEGSQSGRDMPQRDHEVLAHAEIWIIEQALWVRPDRAPCFLVRLGKVMLCGNAGMIAQAHGDKLARRRRQPRPPFHQPTLANNICKARLTEEACQ